MSFRLQHMTSHANAQTPGQGFLRFLACREFERLSDRSYADRSHDLKLRPYLPVVRRSLSSRTVPKFRPPKLKPLYTWPLTPTRAPREGTPRRVTTQILPVPSSIS